MRGRWEVVYESAGWKGKERELDIPFPPSGYENTTLDV
jgi:hypothetical protein